MSRKDIHRPSAMNPKDYRVLAVGEVERDFNHETGRDVNYLVLHEIAPRWSELGQPDQSTWEGHREDQCDHCGAHIKYFSVIEHIHTGEIITVGLNCTGRFASGDWNYYREFLKTQAINDRRERKWREAHPDLGIALQFCLSAKAGRVASKIAHGLRQWGISDKQTEVIRREYADYLERLRKAETQPETTCPAGRHTVTGTVLSVKEVENNYAVSRWDPEHIYKMLVQDERGFKVYGTLPGCFGRAIQGHRVTFRAEIEPSAKDPFFGIYKRPTKAECLDLEVAVSSAPCRGSL